MSHILQAHVTAMYEQEETIMRLEKERDRLRSALLLYQQVRAGSGPNFISFKLLDERVAEALGTP